MEQAAPRSAMSGVPSLAVREEKLKTSFRTQAGALFRKNAAQQRKSVCANVMVLLTPVFFCVLLFVLQRLINSATDTASNKCGCLCLSCCTTSADGVKTCRTATAADPCPSYADCQTYDTTQCGFQYSTAGQAGYCQVESPSVWPPLLQVPSPGFLAHPQSPAAAMMITGSDPSLAQNMKLFPEPDALAAGATGAAMAFQQLGRQSGAVYAGALSLLGLQLGTFQKSKNFGYYIEPGFVPDLPDYNGTLSLLTNDTSAAGTAAALEVLTSALSNISSSYGGAKSPGGGGAAAGLLVAPLQAEPVWMPSVDAVNRALYCGYKQARCNGSATINEYANAWDFGATSPAVAKYSLRLWYNATGRFGDAGGQAPTEVVRVSSALNAATNAFLSWALGPSYRALLVGLMEMPKPPTQLRLDIASLVGTLFYTWLLQLLLPVMLATLVSEKEGRLRTMMKMHGLGDGAYWAIQYLWYFSLNFVYTWILIGVGSAIGLSFFTRTSYSFQFVFYLLWVSCLVAFSFLLSALFSKARTAVVVAFLYVFGTGLVGYLLLQNFVASNNWWVIFLEIVPGFALYRGLYEIAQYAFRAAYQGGKGITWATLSDPHNGLAAVMIICGVEAVVFLALAWYLEQVAPGDIGVPRHPLFFLGMRFKSEGRRRAPKAAAVAAEDHPGAEGGPSKASVVQMEPADVAEERAAVEALASGPALDASTILIRNLNKVFPGKAKKVAVRDLTMSVARGECFGLLGPNGAGKSTTINILTGFLTPSHGTALVQGHDIRTDMDKVYGLMGVCPQDNLLWERLTAREHLLFYGRLKNLSGGELAAAVEAALRGVNLLSGGVADKQVRTFSGGMKRRLSVAISLIGDPLVVYLDEPSTGLDPASRKNLWDVVKAAKPGRGIILTTHSMEEAAVLCDRLGIFVGGQLVCIGAPKELTARYGDYLVFTITTPPEQDAAADALVRAMSPGARLTYSVAGTRRYELPVGEVTLSGVFEAMERAGAGGKGKGPANGADPNGADANGAAASGSKGVPTVGGLTVLDWGVANATLEEVFIKFAKSIGAEGGN